MAKNSSGQRKKWKSELKRRLRVIVQTEHDFQEKKQFSVTPIKLISMAIAIIMFFIIITVSLISFTPLRILIPGYSDPTLREELYDLEQKTDSLNIVLEQMLLYNANIRRILVGEDSTVIERVDGISTGNNIDFEYKISPADSAFRSEFEHESMYNIHENYAIIDKTGIRSFAFYPPIKGIITSKFDPKQNHIGTDIIPIGSELVKSVMDGVVIFNGWTVETGNVIIISHLHSIISIYKHNSVLLKKTGDFVRAGEAIAVCGNSGELTTGPHLHFELWFNNRPVNAEEIIDF
ncbi:M23 family metallopeptidase [Bacteroidales bacterium OttesenSCG-928-K03]|nr:M23 family metallopeptidase [Odoribacter sp. OttesenSCG-928-L07]MDL2239530.1 M23 family metallopeptidase [Bacteroidales bacterium OttesenSCG-928-L14]MDL2242207.1 M23 family metallopeptidase [Bacteroidales bacterium OttesenSCG-928-K03]